MAYPNGGNKHRSGRWYLAPNIPPLTLEERRAMLIRAGITPTTPTAAEAAQADVERRERAARAKR